MTRRLHLLHRTGNILSYTLDEDLDDVLARIDRYEVVIVKTNVGKVYIRQADFSVFSGTQITLGGR